MPSLTPARRSPVGPGIAALRSLRGWEAAVAVSIAVLATVALALALDWLVTEDSHTSTYLLTAPVSAVEVRLSAGDAQIVGGGPSTVLIQHTDTSAFGRSATNTRSVTNGVLRVASGCPPIVLGSCSSSYRLTVPDGVAVAAHTAGGSVRLAGFRGNAQVSSGSGDIAFDAFCGFALSATSRSGNVQVATACAPKSIQIRSDSGSIKLLVPPGRYRVHAVSGSGTATVSGVEATPSAPFTIDLFSRTGNVSVVGGL